MSVAGCPCADLLPNGKDLYECGRRNDDGPV
jgi:hypothetical protein